MKDGNVGLGHIACFLAYAIFGINIVVCKDLTSSHVISPIGLFCLRSIGAGLLFWVISLFLPGEKIEKSDYVKIFMASVLGFFLTQMTFLMAISDITPMDCSVVASLSPIYTMLIAAIVLKEPVTLKKFGGVLLSLCGIIWLIMNSVNASSYGVAETKPIGVVLIVLNSLCFSIYLGVFKPVIMKYSVITFMKWIFLFSMILALPFSVTELVALDYGALSGVFLWELLFLIGCATFVTYLLIPIGQKYIRPTLVSMYSYVQPIVAIVISICIGMDSLGWQKVVAAIFVFAGVLLVNYSKKAH